jgi:lipoyl(octanoyl) transferase
MTTLDVQRLGRRRYAEVWELQRALLEQRIEGAIPDTLLLVEHEPVYTWGKRTKAGNLIGGPDALKALGPDVFEVERGGDVTVHGPGQLVGYPICHLGNLTCGRDLHAYMRALEDVIIELLASYGLHGERAAGMTGVWVPTGGEHPAKIAALGVRVRKWCTMHGFALNVSDAILPWFQHIVPCGISDRGVTSLESCLGAAPAMDEVQDRAEQAFRKVMLRS